MMTFKEHGIKPSSNLIVTPLGLTLDVINPQVRILLCKHTKLMLNILCIGRSLLLVDCTASMGPLLMQQKLVQKVRDDLAHQFQSCEIRLAFVRYIYMDHDKSSRNTFIDFIQSKSACVL